MTIYQSTKILKFVYWAKDFIFNKHIHSELNISYLTLVKLEDNGVEPNLYKVSTEIWDFGKNCSYLIMNKFKDNNVATSINRTVYEYLFFSRNYLLQQLEDNLGDNLAHLIICKIHGF